MDKRVGIESHQRRFLLILISTSLALWHVFFELGAWGQVFYDHFFHLWILSLTISIAVFLFPSALSRLTKLEKFAIIFPSLWLASSLFIVWLDTQAIWSEVLIFSGFVISSLCLPVLILVLLTLLEPDSINLPRSDVIKLCVVTICVSCSGYMTGKYNHLFMTCDDFIVAGSSAPPTCTDDSTLDSIFVALNLAKD